MKVLIISTNTLPAYVAGAALAEDHDVEVFEALFAKNLDVELENKIAAYSPEVIGISIRLVHGFVLDENAEYGTRHLGLRVRVNKIVECVKRVSDAHIV